jgi:transposase InsO family protein
MTCANAPFAPEVRRRLVVLIVEDGRTLRRAADYSRWLHHYNRHRPHSGIDGVIPVARVHNLPGNHS